HNECEAISDKNETTFGTCYTREECVQHNGVQRGNCANGDGVCCVFENSCGKTVNANVSYFLSPDYPNAFNEPFSCTLKVCQYRVDFIEFEIANPIDYRQELRELNFGSINSESNCKEDLFVVTQSNRNQPIPVLCGTNTGHHLYIPVDESDSNVIAFTVLTGIRQMDRKWRIKITQLPCDLPQEFLDIDYSICIRKPKNMCYLSLTNAPEVQTIAINGTNNAAEDHTNSTDSALVDRIATLVQSEARPLTEPIQVGDTPRSMSAPFFDTSEALLPLRARAAFYPRRTSRRDGVCQTDHYWITYPGSNRMCSYDLEPLISPVIKKYVTLETNKGNIELELFCSETPKTCENFVGLSRKGKYDNTIFHRVIKDFMIQGGDPTGTGRGGTSIWGTKFADEFRVDKGLKHDSAGILSMANSGNDTNGSQFFITLKETPHLDGKHTVFGKVSKGLNVVKTIGKVRTKLDKPVENVYILSARVH
ncbi:unnamed protein product, partial [Medioppia subpectinata]